MRRVSIRDLALVLLAAIGLHAVLVTLPARLVRSEPSLRMLPLTAPDCATLMRSTHAPNSGGLHAGAGGPIAAASPVRP